MNYTASSEKKSIYHARSREKYVQCLNQSSGQKERHSSEKSEMKQQIDDIVGQQLKEKSYFTLG